MRIVKIKNASGSQKTWLGTVVEDGYYYNIEPAELIRWANNSDLLIDIADGYAIINDGTNDIIDVNNAINHLKNIVPAHDEANRLMVSEQPRLGSSCAIVSHNYCDKCTWFEHSIRQDGADGYGVELTYSDGYNYQSNDGYWIDLSHGRHTGEDLISSSYLPIITVDGETKTEDTDFTIDYRLGKIIFDQQLTEQNIVKAKYSYAGSSVFTIKPDPGKKLTVIYTEVQFTTDVKITSPIIFQGFGYNPYDLPNKVAYGAQDKYKSAKDFLNKSNKSFLSPKFGELDYDIVVLPFEYVTAKVALSSQGAEIRIWTENDVEIEGQYGTMAGYCLSEDE